LSGRVSELLNAFDVYVLCSITEGICNSLLEAMATGLPVVVTATGGNPEVVVAGQSGLLFPVGDSHQLVGHLAALQARRDLGYYLGSQAVQRVRTEFSLESMVRRYEEVYNELAISRRGKRGSPASSRLH
jgi:glycosyltransferase involved in cell wall biosynthesis